VPVRDKAVTKLAGLLADGGVVFHSLDDEVSLRAGESAVRISRDVFESDYGRLWEELISSVDWSRVLLEAVGRHLALGHEGLDEADFVCGECLEQALLARETNPDWKKGA